MYGVDLFLIAATVAYLLLLFTSIFVKRRTKLYELFTGKYSAMGHIILMSIAALELIGMTAYDVISNWSFTMALWPFGVIIFTASLVLLASTLSESGFGALFGMKQFKNKHLHKGTLWHQFKQPLALGIGGMYIGLALLSGHIVYFVTAALLSAGYVVLDKLFGRLQS
jgi:protein-S-isoprenylcysteine O-methyltransferase Ste14